MDVGHTTNDQLVPTGPSPLPIWSFLVYMLLVETNNIGEDDLGRQFCLPRPPKVLSSSNLELIHDARSRRYPEGLKMGNKSSESPSYSGKLAEVGNHSTFGTLH